MMKRTKKKQKNALVTVWFTKNWKLRARIKVQGEAVYEVSVGGAEWQKGKGIPYQHLILEKCARLWEKMTAELQYLKVKVPAPMRRSKKKKERKYCPSCKNTWNGLECNFCGFENVSPNW